MQELKWELSSVSPLDYLDQIIARIGLSPELDLTELKRRTETILVLAMTEYQFCYLHPSVLAATGLIISVKFVAERSNETTDDVVTADDVTDDGNSFDDLKNRILGVAKVDQVRKSTIWAMVVHKTRL